MNILVTGSGGREHALAWKLRQSDRCDHLYMAPGNAGTRDIAENVDISPSDFAKLGDFALEKKINMVVVGPEAPLVQGIRDYFDSKPDLRDILFIGPGKEGAMLEGSKDFAKQFMQRHKIPTAGSKTFTANNIKEAIHFIRSIKTPVVLKADGLAAGKGVIICEDHDEAEKILIRMLEEKMFGEASSKVVIEDFLSGIELSVFLLTDGENYLILPEAKDYKRIGKNDTGPNTGGMGAVSPVRFADPIFMNKVEERIVKPTVQGLKSEHIDYRGFLFLGLMNQDNDPYVIEYNVRMGDPESQVVMPRLANDLVDLLEATATKKLAGMNVETVKQTAVTVVLASGGYPGHYEKGKEITGLDGDPGKLIFHAGTAFSAGNRIITNGGRVLAVTGTGENIESARRQSYGTIRSISWNGMQYRDDIGTDLLHFE